MLRVIGLTIIVLIGVTGASPARRSSCNCGNCRLVEFDLKSRVTEVTKPEEISSPLAVLPLFSAYTTKSAENPSCRK